jgi:hypothetical protein
MNTTPHKVKQKNAFFCNLETISKKVVDCLNTVKNIDITYLEINRILV